MAGFDGLTQPEKLRCLSELACSALPAFGIEPAESPALVNLSENATYRVDDRASGRRYALRVHRDGYQTRNTIASELAWLYALRRDNVAITPVAVPGIDGELIQLVRHPAMERPRHVVLFEWENGDAPSESDHLFDKFATLGETAARMHLHSQGWTRPVGFERHIWDFETGLGATPHWGSWRDGMGLDTVKLQVFSDAVSVIEERLDRFGKSPERFGLIHSDMRLANLLLDGDTVKVLDFDDCGFSWHLYDAATAVSFFEHEPHVPQLMKAWVEGYRRVIDLPGADEAEIPTFVMLRRMILVAWIGSHAETELARSMGAAYTASTVGMCRDYIAGFG